MGGPQTLSVPVEGLNGNELRAARHLGGCLATPQLKRRTGETTPGKGTDTYSPSSMGWAADRAATIAGAITIPTNARAIRRSCIDRVSVALAASSASPDRQNLICPALIQDHRPCNDFFKSHKRIEPIGTKWERRPQKWYTRRKKACREPLYRAMPFSVRHFRPRKARYPSWIAQVMA